VRITTEAVNQEVKLQVRTYLGTENQGCSDALPSSPLWIIHASICHELTEILQEHFTTLLVNLPLTCHSVDYLKGPWLPCCVWW